MKHTTEELLLAAAVLQIAQELRASALVQATEMAGLERPKSRPEEGWDGQREQREKFQRQWRAENPPTAFARQALSELEVIAAVIASD